MATLTSGKITFLNMKWVGLVKRSEAIVAHWETSAKCVYRTEDVNSYNWNITWFGCILKLIVFFSPHIIASTIEMVLKSYSGLSILSAYRNTKYLSPASLLFLCPHLPWRMPTSGNFCKVVGYVFNIQRTVCLN